jgi:hypothetical protein
LVPSSMRASCAKSETQVAKPFGARLTKVAARINAVFQIVALASKATLESRDPNLCQIVRAMLSFEGGFLDTWLPCDPAANSGNLCPCALACLQEDALE